MPRKTTSPPKYAKHSSGQARVRLNGEVIYLGRYGSPESKAKYAAIVAQWSAERDGNQAVEISNDQLALAFTQFCEATFRKDGEPTAYCDKVRAGLRYVVRYHGPELASDFTPRTLKRLRERMITDGRSRRYINDLVQVIVRMYRWAASEELIDAVIPTALATVEGLRQGRSEARETEPVLPVAENDVDAVLPHVSRQIAAMIELQRLTGMRPSEVLILRPFDITIRTDGVWSYRPRRHKTEHHSRQRVVFIGPQAQDVLRPFMDRDANDFCFKPCESDRRHRNKRGPGQRYRRDSYRTAIHRACEIAFEMPKQLRKIPANVSPHLQDRLKAEAAAWRAKHCWSPNQLRHTHGTRVRKEFGLEAAQTVLGHSSADVTQIYAERDFELAASIQKRIG